MMKKEMKREMPCYSRNVSRTFLKNDDLNVKHPVWLFLFQFHKVSNIYIFINK